MSGKNIYRLCLLVVVVAVLIVGMLIKHRGSEPETLPEGVLAVVNGEPITEDYLNDAFSKLPPETKEFYENDREGFLEELIREKVLVQEARRRNLHKNQEETSSIIEALKEEVTKGVEVSEEDVRKFYEEHREEYEGKPGGSYEEMCDSIAEYLRYELVEERFEKFTDELLSRAEIARNEQWLAEQRKKVRDPLEEAKGKGRPVIADFGAGKCPSCKKMIPIMEELKEELDGKVEVVVVDTSEDSALVRKYGIVTIPTQLFFDAEGNEVYRHIGFMPKKEILEKLDEVRRGVLSPEKSLLKKVEGMLKEGSYLAVVLVFLLGLLTASNPCVLTTIPLVIGFIGGYEETKGLKKSFFLTFCFVLGLAVMFAILGIIAGLTGSIIGDVGSFWTYFVGGVCIIIGLHLLEVVQFNIPVPQGIKPKRKGLIGAFLFGLLFGVISTPCAVPIVAVLAVIIAAKGSVVYGAVMLLVYSLGHSILILAAGTSIGVAKGILESRKLTKATNALRKVAASLIIVVGFYFLFR